MRFSWIIALVASATWGCAEGANDPGGGGGAGGDAVVTATAGTGTTATATQTAGPVTSATATSTTTGAPVCGDDAVDPGEDCDGTDLGTATCVTEGFAGGDLLCTATCTVDTGSCKPELAEGFEAAGLPAGFSSSGSANWYVNGANAHMGAQSARSGPIFDFETTSLSVTVTFDVPGSISFWHRESTEPTYDVLVFYADGVPLGSWDVDSWQLATFNMAAGTHVFQWVYEKDGSLSFGADAVWVDDISATNGYVP